MPRDRLVNDMTRLVTPLDRLVYMSRDHRVHTT